MLHELCHKVLFRFVQIGIKWNIAPRGIKKAQILFLPPVLIKIYNFDAKWVMPQSFVHIRPNWNEMEYSAKRTKKCSDFISFTFNNIHDMDATWVMPQSFVQIRVNWNEMEYSAKKCQEDKKRLRFCFFHL